MKKGFRKVLTTVSWMTVAALPVVAASSVQAASTLSPGQSLEIGQSLESPNGKYQLVLQDDGNLVIYDQVHRAHWRSGTRGTDPGKLVMQADGNLVLFSATNVPFWHTGTFNHVDAGVQATLNDAGNIVLTTVTGGSVWDSEDSTPDGLANQDVSPNALDVKPNPAPQQRVTAKAASSSPNIKVDRKTFFDGVRSKYGRLTQRQVDGINFLLASMEKDTRPAWKVRSVWIRQIAYLFSTVKHEVANTYQPIEEYSDTLCRRYEGGCRYKGRGYVQLTHRSNYRKMSPVVGVDLVAAPTRALEPKIAYPVMSQGMYYGMFTGRQLGSYIKQGSTDYVGARRVVNGTDRAELLAGYARTFQGILERAVR